MNFIGIFCCYVLLPYFASIVSPPEEAITCYAGIIQWSKYLTGCLKIKKKEAPLEESEEQPVDENLYTPRVPLDDQYFVQNSDHYHFTNNNTWKQRYLVYGENYNENGVIFLRIGTDEDITPWNMQNGRWYKYCRKARALCVGIERRGYGQSLPNGNIVDYSLKFINTDQTLADVAWFIFNFKELNTKYSLPEKLKWVVHGKGKQGTLATWLRMKFPHLVHATLSLSAPLLAKEDYDDYFKFVDTEMLDKENNFKSEINKAFLEIRKQINDKKFKELVWLFNVCDKNSFDEKKNGKKNTEFMYFLFVNTVGIIMQYGNDILELMKNKAINIMLDTTEKYKNLGSPMNRFAYFMKLMLKKYKKSCLEINYFVAINGYKTTSSGYQNLDYLLPEIFGNRSNLFQSCNEFGQFETYNKFFGTSTDLTFYENICRDVFGEQYGKELLELGVRRTNMFYGGLKIVVSHVIFVYGSNDPYRKLGMIDHLPEKSVVRFLEGARQCFELDCVKGFPGLRALEKEILVILLDWLQINYESDGESNHIESGTIDKDDDSEEYFAECE